MSAWLGESSRRGIVLAMFAALAFFGCMSDGAIVGGSCMDGYAPCGHKCVDLQSDSQNCGACGTACAGGAACVAGRCGTIDDAQPPESGPPGDAGPCEGGGCDGSTDATPDTSDSDLPDAVDEDASVDAVQEDVEDGTPDGTLDGDASMNDDADDALSEESGCPGTGCDAPPNDSSDEDAEFDASMDAADDVSADVAPDTSVDAAEDACTPPYNTTQNCGQCGVVCQTSAAICKPDNTGLWVCAACEVPLDPCGSFCVDLQNDWENCGTCGNVCPTGICQAGKCRGSSVGHAVLIGMNYRTWTAGSPAVRLFANAAFLPSTNPVRIARYAEFADTAPNGSVNQVNAVLNWSSTYKGRSFTVTDFTAYQEIPASLSIDQHDLLLIHDQPNASPGTLAAVGDAWKATLSSYVLAGGTIVVLVSANGQNEMPSLLSRAGLLDVSAVTSVNFSVLVNDAPADVVGLNVQSPFLARVDTVSMATNEVPNSLLSFIVDQQTPSDAGANPPVVVHRVILP